MEATLVFASPASSSQERRVAIMRRDAEWLQPGPKQSGLWQLIVSRLEICHCHQPVRSVRSAPVKSSLKCPYSYLCQMVFRSFVCTKAKTFLFSKDQNISEHSQKLVFTWFEFLFWVNCYKIKSKQIWSFTLSWWVIFLSCQFYYDVLLTTIVLPMYSIFAIIGSDFPFDHSSFIKYQQWFDF